MGWTWFSPKLGASIAAVIIPVMFVVCTMKLKTKETIQKNKSFKSWNHSFNKKDTTFIDLIGNTPLIFIPSLSELTRCKIYGKAEFMNPGGSSKDRIALSILRSAQKQGLLNKGGKVFEGTVGSTGLSLAMVCNALGLECHIVVPNDIAKEKLQLLQLMGAKLETVPPVSIAHPEHYVNVAKKRAEQEQGVFTNQFENPYNFLAHYETTGPEIYSQLEQGQLDAFVCGAGTGGTIAGITRYLKPKIPGLKVILADPFGSGLLNKIKYNVMYSSTEAEGTRRRHQVDTLVEGIGINRITKNFELGESQIDDAIFVSDQEAVKMARFILKKEGLFLGSSSAIHLVACVKVAQYLGPGHRILTILSDHGARHITKFWSDTYLESVGLSGDVPENLDFIAPVEKSKMKI